MGSYSIPNVGNPLIAVEYLDRGSFHGYQSVNLKGDTAQTWWLMVTSWLWLYHSSPWKDPPMQTTWWTTCFIVSKSTDLNPINIPLRPVSIWMFVGCCAIPKRGLWKQKGSFYRKSEDPVSCHELLMVCLEILRIRSWFIVHSVNGHFRNLNRRYLPYIKPM